MIDEELLFQRSVEIGLHRKDFQARKRAILALVQAVVTEAESIEPDPGELAAFYEEERAFFTSAPRLGVEQVYVRAEPVRSGAAARAAARTAAERLRGGEDAGAVAAELGDPVLVPLPTVPVRPRELRNHVGPTATRAALDLAPGEVTGPIRTGGGYRVLRLVSREEGTLPPLPAIEAEVRAHHRRRAGDRALGAYLAALRARATIEISP